MRYTTRIQDLAKGDVRTAGGKGASLGELTRAGATVPSGFVVLTSAFEKFLDAHELRAEIDAALCEVDVHMTHTIDDASERIRGVLLSKEMPGEIRKEITRAFKDLDEEFVAVRALLGSSRSKRS